MNKIGSLKIIVGPMYAGKSTELIRLTNRLKFLKKNVLAINHSINNRYGSSNISTHNKNYLENCLSISKLKELLHPDNYLKFISADYLIIEEIQFFEDAFDMIKIFVEENGKHVICAGLTADSNRNVFGDVTKLMLIADEIQMLKALCSKCGDGTLAPFTKKCIIADSKKVRVGSFGVYEAVCRKHFLE